MEPKLKEKVAEMDSLYRLLVNSLKRSLGRSYDASVGRSGQDVEEADPVNPQAYLLANQGLQEVEVQKAMIMAESRHDKWKAGGPV